MSIIRTYPSGYAGASQTWREIRKRADVALLDPQFKRRLLKMMREASKQGKALGIGGGGRTTAQQTALFLSRHHVDPAGSIVWNGQRWTRNPGTAPAAPPGSSYHEATTPLGHALAVDMVGDLAWMKANCGWFGLCEFSTVNNEPWHVQPAEIPTARRNYVASFHHPLKRWFK